MAFSPNMPVTSSISVPHSSSVPISGADFARSATGYIVSRYGPSIARAAQTRLDSTVDSLADKLSGKSKIPSNSGNSGGSDKFNNGGPGGRRSKSRKPSTDSGVGGSLDSIGIPEFGLNSGIDSGVIINPLQQTTDYYSPMFIQCGSFFSNIEKQDDSLFSQLVNSEVYFKYKIIVQAVITNSFSNYFTQVSFFEYIDKVSYALQLYYMIDSIIAYTTKSSNRNIAMYRLRMAITPDIANGHSNLKEFLQTIPIPPNLLEYIRYMFQNFSLTDVEGSPIIRLSLDDSLCTSEYKGTLGIDYQTYNVVIGELIELNTTISILAKIRSNWINPNMPPSSYDLITDRQFSTFWHNSDITYEDFGSKMVKHSVNAKDRLDNLYYGILDNRLDGLIYASCSVNVTNNDNDCEQMGIWAPFTDFEDRTSINSSLLHYSNDDTIRPVTESTFRYASMVHLAPYVIVTKDSNPVWELKGYHHVSASIPQVHTLENTTQAVVKSVIWLLEP